MNTFYYSSVELPILVLSATKDFLEKILEESKTKSVSEAELLSLKLAEDMFDAGKQIRFSIDKAVALAEIFTEKTAPKTGKNHENFENYLKEIEENINFLKNLNEKDFENAEKKFFSHPVLFPNQKLIGLDIIPFFMGNMYFHSTTAYDIFRHFGYNIGKKDFLGAKIFAKIQ